MIIADAEMSGLSPERSCIVSLGAVDFDNPDRMFYEECRVFEGADINKESLAVCGFTEAEITDPHKQSIEEMMRSFFHWVENTEEKTLAGQNVAFDRDFLNQSFRRAEIDFAFGYRNFDLHSVALADHIKRGVEVPMKNDHSDLSLDKILAYAGMQPEPKPHHALNGAKLEAECFSRLLYGKNLLPEYAGQSVPDILKA